MPQVCLYFQLHQPYRLGPFSVFDVGQHTDYFGSKTNHNQHVFQKVAHKSYIPMLSILLEQVKQHQEFKFALSASGVFLEQSQKFEPKVMELLQELSQFKEQVEFLAETYYHSLAALYSPNEFSAQVDLQMELLNELFGVTPTTFRNTELIYSNDIAYLVAEMGFKGMLTEAVDRYLGGRSRTQLYRSYTGNPIPLLLKHAPLSDDIAFRFSDKSWAMYPLDAGKYVTWLHDYYQEEIVNLFMDFETFGEHQWEDTGIFDFFREVVRQLAASQYAQFKTPSELLEQAYSEDKTVETFPVYDVPHPISWADIDRDLTAWRDNELQWDTLRLIYAMEQDILKTNDAAVIDLWRKLQTSDHFYYMCTKWAADGDVHAYFSPYASPWEAYNRYTAVVADLKGRLSSDTIKVT